MCAAAKGGAETGQWGWSRYSADVSSQLLLGHEAEKQGLKIPLKILMGYARAADTLLKQSGISLFISN
jgi:hypothetical protein